MKNMKSMRTCKKGHQYYKSSDCPVCPICEAERKFENNVFSSLPAPARRTLKNRGITTVFELSKYSKTVILQLHGMGKTSIPKLVVILEKEGLKFKGDDA